MVNILKKLFLATLFILILLLIAWRLDRAFFHPYIPDYQDQIHSDVTSLKFTVPKDKESCEAQSGVWKKIGPRPFEECNLPTKDAGKICSGSNECEGICLADLTREDLRKGMNGKLFKTQGKCSSFIKTIGCQAYVYQGWAQVVCAD